MSIATFHLAFLLFLPKPPGESQCSCVGLLDSLSGDIRSTEKPTTIVGARATNTGTIDSDASAEAMKQYGNAGHHPMGGAHLHK